MKNLAAKLLGLREHVCILNTNAHDNFLPDMSAPDLFERRGTKAFPGDYVELGTASDRNSDMATVVDSPPDDGCDIYSNFSEIQKRTFQQPVRVIEEEFFQHSGTTLEATVDLFHELFPHLASKLSIPGNHNGNISSDTGWIERIISYWNELGVDQCTINTTLHHLGIGPGSVKDCDSAVRLLFQRFAEALTGICLAHPCSTVIFLTAFDELKATRVDASEAVEQRRQLESELAECQRRITLLADESDERCRQVEVVAAEKLTNCQKKSTSAITQIKLELEAERILWLSERETLLTDSRKQAELLAKLQKKYEEEAADCSYWKQQASQMREEYSSLDAERTQLLERIATLSGRSKKHQSCGVESESDSSGESESTNDLRQQLDNQLAINKELTSEITRLEDQLAVATKLETTGAADLSDNNSSSSKDDPKVTREDSGLGMVDHRHRVVALPQNVSCFEILYANESQRPSWPHLYYPNGDHSFQNEFEALEAACATSSPCRFGSPAGLSKQRVDAETLCNIVAVLKHDKSCQVSFREPLSKECDRLRVTVTNLESNLSESVNAFNSLRSRYHVQLVRSNQLIDLTNQLYAENCRITNILSSSRRRYSIESSTEEQPRALKSPSKRRSKNEQIYVVVGTPTLKHPILHRQ